jgi:putative ABC transport system permease protein
MMRFFSVDADFLNTFEIELKEGRNFRKGSSSDMKQAYLLNESAVKELGWESAVGKGFEVQMSGSEMGQVIGVVKDFHFQSLKEPMRPLALRFAEYFGTISVRVLPDDIPSTIGYIEQVVKSFAPNAPFEYYFLDSDIDNMYGFEMTMSQVFGHFSLLAVIIASMGLLGLTSYVIVWRTKEIGIRKVLGAPSPSIVMLLMNDFLKKVIISNIIAWPVAYFVMARWLQNFAYRASVTIWMFILPMSMVLVIAVLTIGYQSIRAALMNPVETLRYE